MANYIQIHHKVFLAFCRHSFWKSNDVLHMTNNDLWLVIRFASQLTSDFLIRVPLRFTVVDITYKCTRKDFVVVLYYVCNVCWYSVSWSFPDLRPRGSILYVGLSLLLTYTIKVHASIMPLISKRTILSWVVPKHPFFHSYYNFENTELIVFFKKF